ncbi:hypothetical protein LCGC14_2769690, partial [marine sediment metagenome]
LKCLTADTLDLAEILNTAALQTETPTSKNKLNIAKRDFMIYIRK